MFSIGLGLRALGLQEPGKLTSIQAVWLNENLLSIVPRVTLRNHPTIPFH